MAIYIIQTVSMLMLFFSFLIMYVVSIEHTKQIELIQNELDDTISTIERIRDELYSQLMKLKIEVSENKNN